MAEFDIIDLTQPSPPTRPATRGTATAQGLTIGRVDSADIAASLNAIRQDISAHLEAPADGLGLSQLVIRLTLSAEGKVAFVAKGAAEACFEVTFAARR
jgi:hypothetical protein